VVPRVFVREVTCNDTVSRRSMGSSTRGSLVLVGEVTRVAAVSRVSGGSITRGNL
jgi:hypothetical protein